MLSNPLRRAAPTALVPVAVAFLIAWPERALAQDPSAPVPAPAPTPTTAAPANDGPLLRLQIAGPAVWRAQYAPTNVGSLLESEGGRLLRAQTIAPLEGAVQQMLGLDLATFTAARQRLLDFAGSLEAEFWFERGQPEPVVTIRLRGDGKTDLAQLVADLSLLASRAVRAEFAVAEGAVPGTPRVLPLGAGGAFLIEPRTEGRDFVAAITDRQHLGDAIARLAAPPTPPATPPGKRTPPLRLHFRTGAAIEQLGDATRERSTMRAFGVDSLDEFTLELGTAGPHVQVELTHSFRGAERGLFGMLFPAVQGLPATTALASHPEQGCKVGYLDLAALYPTILALGSEWDPDPSAAAAKVEALIGGPTDGLLAQFTGEYVLFGAGEFDPDARDPEWGIALRIRDVERVRAQWRKVRGELGVTQLGAEDLGDGFERTRLGGFVRFDVTTGPGLFVLSSDGEAASERVTAIVAAAKNGEWTKGAAAAPERLKGIARHAPPGWNGFAEGNVALAFGQLAMALDGLQTFAGHLPALEQFAQFDAESQQRLQVLLAEHNLAMAQTLTGYADARWCFRVLW